MSKDQYQWLLSIPGLGLAVVVVVALVQPKVPPATKGEAPAGAAGAGDVAKSDPGSGTPERFLTGIGVLACVEVMAPVPGQRVEFLVVTLPDPAGSQLGYVFDQGADAVIRAAAAAGYVFEGHWFPWEVVGETKDKQPVRRGNPAEQPGVLAFRGVSDINHRVVVLVVGEDPVTGVREGALRWAFDLAGRANDRPSPLRVVSPMYSGSQASIARVVREWKGAVTAFRVCSGSATGLKQWDKLDPANKGVLTERFGGPIRLTGVPIAAERKAVLHYLSRPGDVPPNQPLDATPAGLPPYASLIEVNTGYGAAGAVPVGPEGTVDPTDFHPRPAVELRFPMHVSRMAGVLAKERRNRDERLGLHTPGRVSLTALDATRSAGDLLPAGDDARTAALNMERLDQFWEVIRRERIRHVEIIASDPRDRLFLIQLIRENCPTVVPFGYGGDLLLGHPDYLPVTRGAVLASTYPLRPDHQGRTGPVRGRREAFALHGIQGTYNAVLAQLGKPHAMIDYAPPAATGPDATARPSRPPIWVTAVGENGDAIPLAFFTELPADDAAVMLDPRTVRGWKDESARPSERPYVPHGAGLWYLALVVVLAGGVFAHRAWAEPRPAGATPEAAGMIDLYTAYMATGLAVVAGPALLYFLTLRAVAGELDGWDWVAAAGLLVVVGAAAAWWVAWLGAAAGRARTDSHRPWAAWAMTVVVPGAFLAVLVMLAFNHLTLGDARRWLFVERTADMSGGGSPVLPLAAFAVGFWCYGLVGRSLACGLVKDTVPCPYPDRAGPGAPAEEPADARWLRAAGEVGDRGRELDWVLAHPKYALLNPPRGGVGAPPGWRRVRRSGVVVAVLAAVLCATIYGRAHPTWEGWWWNRLFYAAFAVLAVFTVTAAYRLYLVWKGVERLTAATLGLPMVGAFDRFPDKIRRLLGQYLLASRHHHRDRDVLLYLRDHASAAIGPKPRTRNPAAARQAFDEWTSERGPPPDPKPGDEFDRANAADLCALARKLVGCLVPEWEKDKRPPEWSLGHAPDDAGKGRGEAGEAATDGWVERTERFVAVLAVVYVAQYLVGLRRLALMAAVAAGALLTAATTYQFQPEGLFMTGSLILTVAVGLLIIWVLYQLNRNELVSRVVRSTPNRFSLDGAFVSNVITFVLPLAVVVAVQFAGRTRAVVEPVLGWFR